MLLHDPQTAGLVRALRDLGARVMWRCHVGLDVPNEHARSAWSFLLPYVADAEAYVFSRAGFVWEDLDPARIVVIAPSIDVFAPKNQAMQPSTVAAILAAAGLSDERVAARPNFTRTDGAPGRVERKAELVEEAPLPAKARLLTQVSRWDRLKDPAGVVEAFAGQIAGETDAHLVLAGPTSRPSRTTRKAARCSPRFVLSASSYLRTTRTRVHLALLPMHDAEENAAIVNALQRRSDVICQKSLAEGFGLTVAEAMWKARPVVASRVGGIQDQIIDGVTGVLVDPSDLGAFGAAVSALFNDPAHAAMLGTQANARVREVVPRPPPPGPVRGAVRARAARAEDR